MKSSERECAILFFLLFIAYKADSTYILVKLGGSNEKSKDDVTERQVIIYFTSVYIF